MDKPRIAFIGAGNMASSIIGGLLESGHPASHISAADPYPGSLEKLQAIAPITVGDDNATVAAGADVIILAVKPQVMAEATASIRGEVQASGAVSISIAAGITIDAMQTRLGSDAAIIRCMPNTPALLGCGASALFANTHTSPTQKTYAQTILSAVGLTSWVDSEAQLDAITALSGSGPAYYFLFMEAMIASGVAMGLDKETATAMTLQTALGAARMAKEGDVDLAELRRRVTSPGGTTERAVEAFEQGDIRGLVDHAMQAALIRAEEMAKEMG
ncbi:MAG: pyrroline-5-carboxylate reductase [Halioglobus sp.]